MDICFRKSFCVKFLTGNLRAKMMPPTIAASQIMFSFELSHDKTSKVACRPGEDSNQPVPSV